MKIANITHYFGGKGSSGTYQAIINEIRPHDVLVVPFLGNCAITRYIKRSGHTIGIDASSFIIDCWKEMQYRSPQRELAILRKVGLQKLNMTPWGWFIDDCYSDVSTPELAENDGLGYLGFYDWFKGKITIDMEPMAIIHFTDFRY